MPQKRYLLTPGPTPVPPDVLAALAEPVIHHRSPDFKTVFQGVQSRLQSVFRTGNDVLVFTSSGTGAFEAAFANLLSPGEKALVVSHGEFGTRWQKLGVAYGCEVVPLTYEWGQTPVAEDVSRALAESGARVAFLVHSETSTGVVSDIRSLVAACNEGGVISVVDAISSLGAVPLETDAWGVDVVVTETGESMAAAIRELLGDAERRRAIQYQARSTVETRYDWDSIARRQRQIYESLLGA
jgi:aspartate aminotransferase-like enzyme